MYNNYIDYMKENNISVIDYVILGYHLAVYGWLGEKRHVIKLQ